MPPSRFVTKRRCLCPASAPTAASAVAARRAWTARRRRRAKCIMGIPLHSRWICRQPAFSRRLPCLVKRTNKGPALFPAGWGRFRGKPAGLNREPFGSSMPSGGDHGRQRSMELMQLQMFVAAAEAHSLQKAGERVHRTPQAVSMAIGKLEDEIGVLLFDRASRGFRLTAAGDVFLVHAKRALNVVNEALAAIKEIGSVQKGHLRIGANQSIGEYILPQLAQSFRQRFPGVTLKIVIGYSEAILSALENGDVDVALVAEKPKDRQLQVQLLMTDRLVAILDPRHPLAAREAVTLRELAAESLILLTETSELRERVVETFRRAGIALDPCVETGTLDSVKRMAARDMGIGIVPLLSVTAEESDRLVARTIDAFQQDRPLWIVQPENPSPASQAFVALLKAQIGTAG